MLSDSVIYMVYRFRREWHYKGECYLYRAAIWTAQFPSGYDEQCLRCICWCLRTVNQLCQLWKAQGPLACRLLHSDGTRIFNLCDSTLRLWIVPVGSKPD